MNASDGAREEELVQRASWQRDDAARRGDSEKTWLEEVYYTKYLREEEVKSVNQAPISINPLYRPFIPYSRLPFSKPTPWCQIDSIDAI